MSVKCLGTVAAISLTLIIGVSPARGNLVYDYSFSQTNYAVAPGGTVNVDVFLTETGAAGDPFVLAPAGAGLLGTGVRLNYSGSATAKVLSGADISGNAAFDNGGFGIATDVNTATATAGFTQTVFFNSAVHGDPAGTDSYQLLLGSFTFTAGLTPGSFAVTATRFDDGDNVITGTGSSLDDLIGNGTTTVTVTGTAPVPEPSAWALFSMGSLSLIALAWRKPKSTAAAA